jgi:hypothetical protein
MSAAISGAAQTVDRKAEWDTRLDHAIDLVGELLKKYMLGQSHRWYDCTVSETAGTEKLSATVPKGLAAQIRERAGRGNVSAYVTQALLRQLEHDRLGDLVAELEQIHGPVSEDEVAAARSEWP